METLNFYQWILRDGNMSRPVIGEGVVEVRFRGGETDEVDPAYMDWKMDPENPDSDIVAYRRAAYSDDIPYDVGA